MRSPEVSGGAGFTLEAQIGGAYLAALLTQSAAQGLADFEITRVAFQQSGAGEPLDDIIVDAVDMSGREKRVSLQVKSSLKIGAGKTNTDFREIVHGSWRTLQKPSFRYGVDRCGGAVVDISDSRWRNLNRICENARHSANVADFVGDASSAEKWNQAQIGVLGDVRSLINEISDQPISDAEFHKFFRHFVLFRFDFPHEGSSSRSLTISQLKARISGDAAEQASALFTKLIEVADVAANCAGSHSRASLLDQIESSFRIEPHGRIRDALTRLTEFSRGCVNSINDDIAGIELTRPKQLSAIRGELSAHKLVYVRGLPGSGKSVMLKRLASEALESGPCFVLKADRISAASWNAFAQAIGIGAISLVELLTEIAHAGTAVLFIDGIDRIPAREREVVNDILRTLLRNEAFGKWRVLVTARDDGIEPLRNWLPPEAFEGGVAFHQVEPLADEEAEQLAIACPDLRPVLFGSAAVKEIARRPFFASILSRRPKGDGTSIGPNPKSEIELLDAWWLAGGYAAASEDRLLRNQALLELARLSGGQVGQPIRIAALSASAKSVVSALKEDGVLREIKTGISIQFAHDIFQEWALAQVLVDQDTEWVEFLKSAGEPPAMGRVVGLHSQRIFFDEEDWGDWLTSLASDDDLRSQWVRTWLLGPISAPEFPNKFAKYAAIAKANDYKWLRRILLWFQAERTVPNRHLLQGATVDSRFSANEIIRYADYWAWPADFSSWGRVLSWILASGETWPRSLIPLTIPLFQVWQNALLKIPNDASKQFLELALEWLSEVEEVNHPKDYRTKDEKWESVSHDEMKSLERELRRLVLAPHTYSEITREYLNRLVDRERYGRSTFQEVLSCSDSIAQTAPDLLVDYVLGITLAELPLDSLDRWEREERESAKQYADARKLAAKVPEDQRTFDQRMTLSPSPRIRPDISSYEWQRLALSDDGAFFPPSPLREPFCSLFKHAPDQALRLVRSLSNHVIECWRQLHRIPHLSRIKPVPLKLDFPWGGAEFWGSRSEFLWYRGMLGPHAMECALQALEAWAFERAARGDEIDLIIEDIVTDNPSVAALGVAGALAVEYTHVSAATMPLVACQRLWHHDIHRQVQDYSPSTQLIGFSVKQHETDHIDAIRQSGERRCRKLTVRELVPAFLFGTNKALRDQIASAISEFPEELPFEFEEHKDDAAYEAELRRTAEIWSELAKPENWSAAPIEGSDKILLEHNNPAANAPDVQEISERYEKSTQGISLQVWVSKAFDDLNSLDLAQLQEKVALAREVHRDISFACRSVEEGLGQAGVAGVAALAVICPDAITADELSWARNAISEAETLNEPDDELLVEQAILPWHPCIFAARALSAEIRRDPSNGKLHKRLLTLLTHRLNAVADEALSSAFACFSEAPFFSWAAFDLSLRLTIADTKGRWPSESDQPRHDEKQRKQLIRDALDLAATEDVTSLVTPPPAWTVSDESGEDGGPIKIDPQRYLRWDRMTAIVQLVPFPALLSAQRFREATLQAVRSWFDWTMDREIGPSEYDWPTSSSETRTELIEWRDALAGGLGKVYDELEVDEALDHSLRDIFELDDVLAIDFLAPMVSAWTLGGVCDAEEISSRALQYLDLAADRVVCLEDLQSRYSYRGGHLGGGFDLPKMVSDLLFVSVKDAQGAARFANGDWHDVGEVLPIIEKLITAGGWNPRIVGYFLEMCERAWEHISTDWFADRVLGILSSEKINLLAYQERMIPARIATLVQQMSDRDAPLSVDVASKLLRILDHLVDLGDRRSAALQLSPAFRNVARP